MGVQSSFVFPINEIPTTFTVYVEPFLTYDILKASPGFRGRDKCKTIVNEVNFYSGVMNI